MKSKNNMKLLFLLCLIGVSVLTSCGMQGNNSEEFIEYYVSEKGDSSIRYICGEGDSHFCKEYYPNGQLSYEVKYIGDRLMGIIEVYDTNGVQLDYGHLVNGTGFVICYDNNGQKERAGKYLNGNREGLWVTYGFSGDTINQDVYSNGYPSEMPDIKHNSY
jgi:antitoxin component YwqK of YwqJK toxin-antitoxin module